MTDFSEQIGQYEERINLYGEFAKKISEEIRELGDKKNIDIVNIEHRPKSIVSLRDKIDRKGEKYRDIFFDVTDLSGVRVILYFKEDGDTIIDAIRDSFNVDEKNSKDIVLDEKTLGYQSRHLVISLNEPALQLPSLNKFQEFKCEVQVRTIGQHAWSAIEHKYNYKADRTDIPKSTLRRLNILSGVLEMCDNEFSQI